MISLGQQIWDKQDEVKNLTREWRELKEDLFMVESALEDAEAELEELEYKFAESLDE